MEDIKTFTSINACKQFYRIC